MFAGKTKTLIELAEKLPADSRGVYKPTTDTRYVGQIVRAHSGQEITAKWVDPGLVELTAPEQNVLIDEAQFLTPPAVEKILAFIRGGRNVVLGGLDLNSNGHPFGCMPEFLSIADEVVKLRGACSRCQNPSSRTRPKAMRVGGPVVWVGGAETYEPLCHYCFEKAPWVQP